MYSRIKLITLLVLAIATVSTSQEQTLGHSLKTLPVSNNNELTENTILIQLITRMRYLEDRVREQEKDITLLKGYNSGHKANSERECNEACKQKEHHDDTGAVFNELDSIKKETDLFVDVLSDKKKNTDAIDKVTARTTSAKDSTRRRRKRQLESGYNVSFFAKIVQNVHHLGQNQNVVFETVVTNNGNAYNPYIGAFIAPVGGTYMFSTTLVTFNNDTSHYGIFLNDERITILYVNGAENTSDSTSQTVVVQLNEQDTVSVRHLDSDRSLVGYHHSLFSGFLIAQGYSGVSGIVG